THGETFQSDKEPTVVGARPDICAHLLDQTGYLLISGQIDGHVINRPQGFFQTSDLESGLFFEYDPGEDSLLRFGIHKLDGSTSRLKFGNLRRDAVFNFGVLIQGNGKIQMFGDGKDLFFDVPLLDISCANIRIGEANENLGVDGSISLSISAGNDLPEAESILNSYSTSYRNSLPSTMYKWPLYSGILLIALGNPWKWRKR
ncbi:MAG: hypothetical protein EBQ97_06425, partial [Bacteroidetes bacterium]|nr:hypothetical protein [Bacteroidota bacterium]